MSYACRIKEEDDAFFNLMPVNKNFLIVRETEATTAVTHLLW